MTRTNTDLDYELFDFQAAIYGTTYDSYTFEIIEDGSPIDISGATIVMNVVKYEGATATKSYSVGSGITITDGTNGKYRLDEHDIDLAAGEYLHETTIKLTGGDVLRYLRGRWLIIDNR